jgi:hypothetical protein
MITRKQIINFSILGIAIISITVFIEVLVKPHLSNINSGKVSPFVIYMHNNLEITMDDKPIRIPSQIGIEDHLWNDHSLDKFGAPGMPMDEKGEKTMPGMAPVYTTNDKGRITIGSVADRNYTLGEFLKICGGLDLNEKRINATVNGKPVNNYENIIFEDNQQVKLNVTSIR